MASSAVVFDPTAIQVNTCPKCAGPMVLTHVKPSRIGYETRTFQGINCDHVYHLETATDSMKWLPSGPRAPTDDREIQKVSSME